MFNGTKMRRRTVINANTAEKIGYVSDIEIDELNGRVASVIVRRSNSFLNGMFGIGEMSIPWNAITAMSDEYVLIRTFDYAEKELKG